MASFRENGITIVDLFPSISAGANATKRKTNEHRVFR